MLNELKKHNVEDTTRINILNSLSYAYYQLSPNDGIKYGNLAIELSKKLDDKKRLAYAYHYKGINYSEMGEYAAALDLYKQAAILLEKIKESKKLMAVRNSTAVVYMRLSDYAKALELYYSNLVFYESEKMGNEVAMTSGNIALVYNLMGNWEKALVFNQKAIDIRKKMNDEKWLADLLNSRGNILDDMERIDEAIAYYRQSLYLCRKLGYTKGITAACTNLGNAYNESGQKDSAFYYTLLTLGEYKRMEDKNNLISTFGYLGKMISGADDSVLKKQGISPADKYIIAMKYHSDALDLAKEIGDVYAQAEQLQEISNIYKSQKNYEKALGAFEQHVKLKDSILNDEKKEAVHQAEMQYAVQIKEDSLTLLQQKKDIEAKAEINRQKTLKQFIVVFGGVLLIAAIASFIFYKKRRDAQQKQQEAEFKTEVADTEMKALRAQMNPHFIFNSLNSIGDYIAKNNVQEADRYLGKFAKLMRLILENSEQREVSLADDLKALELYMNLEAMRMNNKFTYEIKVDENIDKENI
jgi:tetratricopeptide (TPR) repeat protein